LQIICDEIMSKYITEFPRKGKTHILLLDFYNWGVQTVKYFICPLQMICAGSGQVILTGKTFYCLSVRMCF